MNVSDLLLKVLHNHGVRQLFGIPGDAINDVIDAIRRQDAIDFVQVRHEETGAFAASGQAKLTGQLAACMGTSGPGAIHLLNGLYDAKMDHAPVIAITGQIATDYIGSEYHQEVDLKSLFADVAVFNEELVNVEQMPDLIMAACRAAITENGVAHLSLPTNMSGLNVSDVDETRLVPLGRPSVVLPDPELCKEAADLISQSERPIIFAGIGCRDARPELLALAKHIKAPIVRSLRGKDVIDDEHPLCIGGVGLLGGSPAVHAFADCDLLIMAGTDFPYRDFYPDNAKYIQIDTVAQHIGRRHRVDVGLVGDAKSTLANLTSAVPKVGDRKFFDHALKSMDGWIERQGRMRTSDKEPITPSRLIREVSDRAPGDTIFLSDTGTSTAWTARHLSVGEGQRYTLSGGLASMAFALPAAIGAQLAYPDRTVIAFAGDGGFGMLMQDFVTAVRYDLPIVVIVLNNGKLGFITLEQEASGLPDYGTELANPDFAKFAEACGGVGLTVTKPNEIGPALEVAVGSGRATVLNVMVDPGALIMPPKIGLGQAANFTLAKAKEFFGSD